MREKSKELKSNLFVLTVVIIVIAADQLSKSIASNFLPVICNHGIAFGVSISNTLAILVVIASLFYLYIQSRIGNAHFKVSISLIFGGGLSNLIDRLTVGCVRDFVNFGFWPSFNLADSAITIGVFMMIYNLIMLKNET